MPQVHAPARGAAALGGGAGYGAWPAGTSVQVFKSDGATPLTDSGNDGLSYWADPNAGNGFFRIKRLNNTFAKTFEPEFGRSLVWAFAVGNVVGLEETTGSFGLSAFPNPTRGTFTLTASGSHGLAQLEVLDAQGRMVQQRQVQLYGDTRIDVDLSGTGSGLYQIRLTSEGHTEQLRVVKE